MNDSGSRRLALVVTKGKRTIFLGGIEMVMRNSSPAGQNMRHKVFCFSNIIDSFKANGTVFHRIYSKCLKACLRAYLGCQIICLGYFLCGKIHFKHCKRYLQPVDHFLTSNGTEWQVKSLITCKSTNVVYFSTCSVCNGAMN